MDKPKEGWFEIFLNKRNKVRPYTINALPKYNPEGKLYQYMIEEINVNGYDAEVVVQPRIDLDHKVIEFKLTNAAVGGLEISKLVSENRGNAIVSLILKSNWMNLSMVCIDQ